MDKRVPKIGSASVIIRVHPQRGVEILTQTRSVIDKSYDTLYDQSQEICGETMELYESILDTVIRGCREELGSPDFVPLRIIGGDDCEYFSTRPGEDEILGLVPYYFVQQLKGPQSWNSLAFIIVVPSDFEPQKDKEGEVSGFRWWNLKDLSEELAINPHIFCGLHYPILLKVCQDIKTGKIKI